MYTEDELQKLEERTEVKRTNAKEAGFDFLSVGDYFPRNTPLPKNPTKQITKMYFGMYGKEGNKDFLLKDAIARAKALWKLTRTQNIPVTGPILLFCIGIDVREQPKVDLTDKNAIKTIFQ